MLVTASSLAVSMTAPRVPANETASMPVPPSSVKLHVSARPAATLIVSSSPSPRIANEPVGLSNMIDCPLTTSSSWLSAAISASVSAPSVPSMTRFWLSSMPAYAIDVAPTPIEPVPTVAAVRSTETGARPPETATMSESVPSPSKIDRVVGIDPAATVTRSLPRPGASARDAGRSNSIGAKPAVPLERRSVSAIAPGPSSMKSSPRVPLIRMLAGEPISV